MDKPVIQVKINAGVIMIENNFLSITLNVSDVSFVMFESEWYIKILGRYNKPAIQAITLNMWTDFKIL